MLRGPGSTGLAEGAQMSGSVELTARGDAPAERSSRWLVVVQRDQPALYAYLRQGFEGIGLVEVILDRRERERRTGIDLDESDAAEGDRRRPATPKERTRWRSFGYRLVPLRSAGGPDSSSA